VMAAMVIKRSWSQEKSWQRLLAIGLLGTMITMCVHGLVDAPYFKNDLAVQCWWLGALVMVVYRESKKKVVVGEQDSV